MRPKKVFIELESVDCGDYVRPDLDLYGQYGLEAYLNRYTRPAASLPGNHSLNAAILSIFYGASFPCRVYTVEQAMMLLDEDTSTGLIRVDGKWITKVKRDLAPSELASVLRDVEKLLRGEHVEMYCLPTLKDEPLPISKIQSGKLRGVITMTWAHLVVGTMLMEDLFQYVYKLAYFLPIKVGFSKWYGGAKKLNDKHQSHLYTFSGDVDAMESSVDGPNMEPLKLFSSKVIDPMYCDATLNWWRQVQESVVCVDGSLYEFRRLPSGFKATSVVACTNVLILFVHWLKETTDKNYYEVISMVKDSELSIYGDNFWFSTDTSGVTFASFQSYISRFGWSIKREPDDSFLSWKVVNDKPVSINPNRTLCHLKYYLKPSSLMNAVPAIYTELVGSGKEHMVVRAAEELRKLGYAVEINPLHAEIMHTE